MTIDQDQPFEPDVPGRFDEASKEAGAALGRCASGLVLGLAFETPGHREKTYVLDGVEYKKAYNTSLPSKKNKELAAQGDKFALESVWSVTNNLLFHSEAMRRGFVIIPGDDHVATGQFDREHQHLLPVFRHPDASAHLLAILSKRLNLLVTDTGKYYNGMFHPNRDLKPAEISGVFDAALMEEEFASLVAVQDAHMAKVMAKAKGTSAPTNPVPDLEVI